MTRSCRLLFWSTALAAIIFAGCGDNTKKAEPSSKDTKSSSGAEKTPLTAASDAGKAGTVPGVVTPPGTTPAAPGTATAAGDKFPLRLVYKKGETHQYKVTMHVTSPASALTMGRAVDLTSDELIDLKVQDAGKDTYTLASSVKSGSVVQNGKKGPLPPQLMGSTTAKINARGEESGAGKPGNLGGQSQFTMRLPDKPVGNGDSWSSSLPNPFKAAAGMAMFAKDMPDKLTANYKVIGVSKTPKGTVLTIVETLKTPLKGQSAAIGARLSGMVDSRSVYQIDGATSQVLKEDAALAIDVTVTPVGKQQPNSPLTGPQTMKQSVKATVVRVK